MNVQKSDAERSSDRKSSHSTNQSLKQLHDLLRQTQCIDAAEPIQKEIRATLPSVDTNRSLPHKKTPSGRTKVLHMNYAQGQTETAYETELEHLRFFARTVQELGIRLEILTVAGCRNTILQEFAKDDYAALDYTLTESQHPVSKWAEDSVEYLENGQVAVPSQFDDELLQWAMTTGRRQRWQGKIPPEHLEEALRDDHLWILLGIRVNMLRMGLERERVARTKGHPVGHIRAYIEGGNMITGENAEGTPVILIGKDAIAATAYIYQLTDNEVRRLICEDFGLDSIEQVIGVEQPGQFHLDMGMLFVGQGVVIVNDSSSALNDAIEMADMVPCLTTKQMAAKLQLKFSLENDAVNDLEAAGLEVRRENLESDVLYNFFNGEFVEGNDGSQYYITNGGPKEHEEKFSALMTNQWQVVKKVFFSPREVAQKSLQERGGVGCRIKGARL